MEDTYGLQISQQCPSCGETILQPTHCSMNREELVAAIATATLCVTDQHGPEMSVVYAFEVSDAFWKEADRRRAEASEVK